MCKEIVLGKVTFIERAWFVLVPVVLIFLTCCGSNSPLADPHWLQGGNLADTDLAGWSKAEESNKLATVGQLLRDTVWAGSLESESDYLLLRERASALVQLIDFMAAHSDTIERLDKRSLSTPIREIVGEVLDGDRIVENNRFWPTHRKRGL